jgi:hypothetical protein
MGMDPLTIGLIGSGVAGLYGAHSQNQTNKQNYNAQQQAAQAQMAQQGQNPFSQMLLQMLGGGGAPQGSSGIMPWGGGMVNMQGGTPSLSGLASGRFNMVQPGVGGMSFARPQAQDAFTYNPSSYAPATIGNVPNINPMMVDPSQINLAGLPQVQAGGIAAPTINLGAMGSRGFNMGQDALGQMLRRSPGPSVTDPTLALDLQNAGQSFNNSDLFSALAPLDQRTIDTQVAGLQGSMGSLGQRFGTATLDKERQLRSDFAQNLAARNAQLQSSSFENAANRQLQALGQRGTREQFQATLPLQQQAQQLATAQALMSGGQQQSSLLAQIAQANAANSLQAQTSNAQYGLQAGGMNQDALIRAALANQGVAMQAGLANQGAGLQAQSSNAGNMLQALLANMGSMNQAGQFGATAANQAGQFNAGQQTQAGQFNAAQQQQFNQFMQSIIGQASGMQSGQTTQNAQLLAIMAGLPGINAPQQQPSAYPGAMGDMSQLLMFLPFLQGLNKPKA